MPKAEYDWEASSPATLAPHSVAKHTILRRYVEEYIRILLSNPLVPELRLTLIDGFAGGGEYVIPGEPGIHLGSPFILIDAVRAGTVKANESLEKARPVDARFVFVEKKRSNFLYLQDAVTRRLDEATRSNVTLIHGAFEEQIDRIIKDAATTKGRRPRCIFVLDQYGYRDVPIDMLAKIMTSLPKSEVFLTLAFDWILAYARSPEGKALRLQKYLNIAPHLAPYTDGSRDIGEITDLPPGDKVAAMRYLQTLLHEALAKQAGATCYTPFFITSGESNRSYWFLHLANSTRANDVVKQLHWDVKNHFVHYGGSGLMMLGYDPGRPPDDTRQQAFHFELSAQQRTVESLLEELPRLIRTEFPQGVSFEDLYARICNETPASKEILRHPIDELCRASELEKRGDGGEKRALSTKIRDTDKILIARQGSLFSFPKK